MALGSCRASRSRGTNIQAQTFLARISGNGDVRWLRAINEIGQSSCDDVVVTSDGDIVAVRTARDNADFTEGAIAKGIKEKPHSGGSGSTLWLARYAGDGTRRWGRAIGETLLGDQPSLAADRDGNVVLAAAIMDPLDLEPRPVGPDGAVMVATIDRDAKVLGMLVALGGAYAPRAAVDAGNGVVFGFSTIKVVKVAGMTIQPATGTPWRRWFVSHCHFQHRKASPVAQPTQTSPDLGGHGMNLDTRSW